MPKEIIYEHLARQKVFDGVEKLARTVAVTMGPKGRNVIVGKSIGAPTITKDGVSVAREVVLSDPFEELGCQLVKEVAGRTADLAGDGTTTATVLAHEIFAQGLKAMRQDYSALDFRRGAEWVLGKLLEKIDTAAQPVRTLQDLENIAIISSNNDSELGKIIAQAYHQVGDNGLVTANAYPGIKTFMKVLDGIELDSGYLSRSFLDKDENEWSVENCYILICNREITHLADAGKLLQDIAASNRPLLIVTKGVKKEAAQILFENSMRGRMRVCAVKIPIFGINNDLWLEDLALLTGTKIIDEELGMPLSEIKVSDLGFAKQVTVNVSNTKIVEPKQNKEAISKKIKSYYIDLDKLLGDRERHDLTERIKFLSGKAAVITVGYSTELELREKGDRVEDAMCAVRAAKEEGYVPGSGVTLLRLSNQINLDELDPRYHLGAQAILTACQRPIRQILLNAAEPVDEIIEKILSQDQFEFGYNVDTQTFGSLFQMGIIDPKKVTRVALQNAVTIALLLITTEAVIADLPNAPSGWQPPAGWRLPSDTNLNHRY